MDAAQIETIRTCTACPEQYDLLYNGEQVGYVRLRWGFFRVDAEPSGQTVFTRPFPLDAAATDLEPEERHLGEHHSDGIFTDETTRQAYLDLARRKVAEYHNGS